MQANYWWGQMHCGPPNQNFEWAIAHPGLRRCAPLPHAINCNTTNTMSALSCSIIFISTPMNFESQPACRNDKRWWDKDDWLTDTHSCWCCWCSVATYGIFNHDPPTIAAPSICYRTCLRLWVRLNINIDTVGDLSSAMYASATSVPRSRDRQTDRQTESKSKRESAVL